MSDTVPSSAAIQRQLDRLLESRAFRNAGKSAPLLYLLVTSTLEGTPLSEYEIGIKVFDRPEDWVPDSNNSTVRTGLTRLRQRLAEYYRQEGASDSVLIKIAEREAVFEYQQPSSFVPAPPSGLSSDFVTAFESYFADPNADGLHCMVTGDPAERYYLDGDRYNNAIGNLIPLSERLRTHIDGLRDGRKSSNLPELEPRYLAEELARRHFAEWRMAWAYGCAHLGFTWENRRSEMKAPMSAFNACPIPSLTPGTASTNP